MKVPNHETQQQLIEIVRAEIQRRKESIWRYGGGLKSSYDFMMNLLDQKEKTGAGPYDTRIHE